MSHFSNLGRTGLRGFILSAFVAGSWLSGCGDDDSGNPAAAGKGGSGAGTAGSSGKGGSAGTSTGGSAGTSTGGSSGSAGEGGGEGGMTTSGGEGGMAQGAQGGEAPVGGEGGGTTSPMCIGANFSIEQVSTTAPQNHDHLPLGQALRADFIDMINTGSPLVFDLPDDNGHSHTLTFTAMQLTTLRNGGALVMDKESSEGNNGHTHTYSIECEP